MSLRSLLAALCLTVPVASQSAGNMDFSFANATGQGSAIIPSSVYYPATSTGLGAPLAPVPGGYPVVIFQHGLSRFGSDYALVGVQLASNGFVAVFPNTAQFAPLALRTDCVALFTILQGINASAGHFLEGALDMNRAGLAGHSFGGRETVSALASNPGFLAGFCFAPGFAGAATTNRVQVPLGIIHGKGDTVLPWQNNGLATFDNANSYTGMKFLYLLGGACNHDNVVGFFGGTTGEEVWLRSASVMTGFFARYLQGNVAGLGDVVGLDARAEPRLRELYVEVEQPELWTIGTPALGQTVRMELMGEPSAAGVMTAATTASVPTRFGLLGLDPATLEVSFRGVPDGMRLATWTAVVTAALPPGTQIPLQGFALGSGGRYRLTEAFTLVIE